MNILYTQKDFPNLTREEVVKIIGNSLEEAQELFPTDVFKLKLAGLANEKLKAIFGNYIVNKNKIVIETSEKIGFSFGKIDVEFFFHFEGKKYRARVLQKKKGHLKKLVLYDKLFGVFNYVTKVIYY